MVLLVVARECPAANGKFEGSHRTDADEFYRRYTFSTPQALRRALAAWQHEYDHLRPHLALKGATPAERLLELRLPAPFARLSGPNNPSGALWTLRV